MYYPEELIEEVRSKNDIVEVVSGYVSLQKKGNSHWGRCPFHGEKTPSFSVSGERQMFHCFGCGAGGNVFTFLMKYENFTFPEAVRSLAERAGVTLPELEYTEEMRKKEGKRARLLAVNKEAAIFFYHQLRLPPGQTGLKYLTNRQLTKETIHKFGLGYAGKNGAQLIQYLRQKGFEDTLIKEAGLATFSEKNGLLSQFWNRVMFPIQDLNHRVIGFGGRVMGDGEPKYLNSPETPVFDKRRNLYGLNFARTARSGNVILCEGYMDVIAMHQAGFSQAVASLGTAFTSEQANLLRRYTENVLLAYDSDGAGVKAALRGIGILREAGLTARVIDMKPYKDPDEFIKNLGREAFQDRIAKAENSFFFELRILEQGYDLADPESKTLFYREIAKKLCGIPEEVERENYLQAVAEKYHIGYENMRKLVYSFAAHTGLAKPMERPKSGLQSPKDPQKNVKRSQRLLLTFLADNPGAYKKISSFISPDDFTEELYQQAARRLFDELEQGNCNPAGIISMYTDEEEQREVSSLFQESLPQINTKQEKEKAFNDILHAVKNNSYRFWMDSLDSKENTPEEQAELMKKVVNGKKALDKLKSTHISLD